MTIFGLFTIISALISLHAESQRVILEGVDRYWVCDPAFEGVRVILSYRGEKYSSAYVCGISGVAFRISGPCPCAPGYGQAMLFPEELGKIFGYECEHIWPKGEEFDPKERIQDTLARIKEEIRAGRPVLMWDAFSDHEWDVVCGFDDEKNEFYGRSSCISSEEYARAKQTHPLETDKNVPLLGAVIIGEKIGKFDARFAETSALKEAVMHAHGASGRCSGTYPHLASGLECYDRWIAQHRYILPGHEGFVGADINSWMLSILQSTRRAASQFLLELAPKYPEVSTHLEMASEHFARESEALSSCLKLFTKRTQEELDEPDRKIRAAAYLRQARAMYALAIDEIAHAIPKITKE